MWNLLNKLNRQYTIYVRFKAWLADSFYRIFFLRQGNFWSVEIANKLTQLNAKIYDHDNKKSYSLEVTNALLLYWAKSFYEKEPETIKWIKGMPSDGIFYDIGPNIGTYSILAGNYCKKSLCL